MNSKKPHLSCVGSGLVALDVVTYGPKRVTESAFYDVGGSCGNVLMILGFMGCDSIPIARLGRDKASAVIVREFTKLKADLRYVSRDIGDDAPVIIHYIKRDGVGGHRFDFFHPTSGSRLPRYRPVTLKGIDSIVNDDRKVDVFYCDRITPANIALAEFYYSTGVLTFIEPQSVKIDELRRILPYTNVLKTSRGGTSAANVAGLINKETVILETMGVEGMRFYRASAKAKESWTVIPAINGINPVDAAGAGDWTTACLIYQSLETLRSGGGVELSNAMCQARAWGALATLFPGARGLARHLTPKSFLSLVAGLCSPASQSTNGIGAAVVDRHGLKTLEEILGLLKI